LPFSILAPYVAVQHNAYRGRCQWVCPRHVTRKGLGMTAFDPNATKSLP
jgi:hypothetical protein